MNTSRTARRGLLAAGLVSALVLGAPAGSAQAAYTSGPASLAPGSSWTTGSAPQAPASVSAAQLNLATKTVHLTWPGSGGATSYRVTAGPVGQSPTWSTTVSSPVVDVPGETGTTYQYDVVASNGFESTPGSVQQTADDTPAPVFRTQGYSTITVTWPAITGASSYTVRLASDASMSSPQTRTTTGTATSFAGLASYTTYWLQVTAVGGPNFTESAVAQVTTSAGLPAAAAANLAGSDNTLCTVVSGDAWCWGRNDSGQAGQAALGTVLSPAQVSGLPAGQVQTVAAGQSDTLCAVVAGDAWCWGRNAYAQLGGGNVDDAPHPTPVKVPGLPAGQVAQLAVGDAAVFARTTDGQVWAWGRNYGGVQLTGTADGAAHAPHLLPLSGVTDVSSGNMHACAITNGNAECWGDGQYGQLGLSQADLDALRAQNGAPESYTPVTYPAGTAGQATRVETLDRGTCVINDAHIYCSGADDFGQLGVGTVASTVLDPRPVTIPDGSTLQQLSTVQLGTGCATTTSGVWCWGADNTGQLGAGTVGAPQPAPVKAAGLPADTVAVRTTWLGACTITRDGSTWCWGGNHWSQLGLGRTDDDPHPTAIQIPRAA